MKDLAKYIVESFQSRDVDLLHLDPAFQDVAKLKILVKKYSSIGEEEEYNDDEDNYEKKFVKSLSYYNVSDKKIQSLKEKSREVWNASQDKKLKTVIGYANALFSTAKQIYNNSVKNSGWADPTVVLQALLASAEYIIDWYGGDKPEVHKALGKLLAGYEEITKLKFADYYEKKKEVYVKNKEAYDFEVNSINEFKSEYKNHKFVYFASTDNESCAELYIVSTKNYETIDEAYDAIPKSTICFDAYNIDSIIKNIVQTGKTQSLGFCYGTYHWGKSEEDNTTINLLGYLDKLPKDIYKVGYGYSSGIRYRGEVHIDDNNIYHWYDSLWSAYNK